MSFVAGNGVIGKLIKFRFFSNSDFKRKRREMGRRVVGLAGERWGWGWEVGGAFSKAML